MDAPTTYAPPADEAARIRARVDALRLPGIIDVHTHFMPQRVLDKVWAYFDSAGPLIGRPWPIAYRTSEEERLATLRSFGVLAFPSLNYPHKPGMAAWLNGWSAGFADDHRDVLRSATFYPEPGAADEVRSAIASGTQLFKVHVQVGDYDMADPLLEDVWTVLEEAGTPIITHAGNGPAPGTFTGPKAVRRLLARHPDLTLVIAHMGMPDYGEFLDICAEHPRVHLDTTMAFTAFTEEATPFPSDRLDDLRALGDRVLFGSDFPNIPYPYLEAVDAVIGLGLGDEWVRGVLHDNAARLLGP
ncbi:amidohydrolase family protein [Janibacter cremeus]|uniref:amidohydrolase family protein n=1 Tax=Janibacter cremeus TaxID=1285192 RepID=UPI0023F7707B|nr:amidohydrolase family protein [Janibacter cremeus]WEV78593.1 amidohydrolase family protein [Janibacter cremeus]